MKYDTKQQSPLTDITKQSKSQNEPSGKSAQVTQQQQALPSADALKGKWKQRVGAAKIAWGKLTDDELLKSAGEHQKLAGLVQERYAISRAAADEQVTKFLAHGNI